MGCDIRMFQECKIDGQWLCFNQPPVTRWYIFFARLAGVRNSFGIKPISSPRGLPEDMSLVTKISWDINPGHTASYINQEEIYGLANDLNVYESNSLRLKSDSEEVAEWLESCSEEKYWSPESHRGLNLGYLFGNSWCGVNDHSDLISDWRWVFWFNS